jgi:hypothetical protein
MAQLLILSWFHHHRARHDRLGDEPLQQAARHDIWRLSHADRRRYLGMAFPLPVCTAPGRLPRSRGTHTRWASYLAPKRPQEAPPRLFEIRDRFGLDKVAQDTLSVAKRTAMRANVAARYLYAIGGAQQIFDIAGRARPEEIIAEAIVAKELTQAARSNSRLMIAPEYVRYELLDGVKIAHNYMHDLYSQGAEEDTIGPGGSGILSPAPVRTPPAATLDGNPVRPAPRVTPADPNTPNQD